VYHERICTAIQLFQLTSLITQLFNVTRSLQYNELPMLICGDFNFTPVTEQYQHITHTSVIKLKSAYVTCNSKEPDLTLSDEAKQLTLDYVTTFLIF